MRITVIITITMITTTATTTTTDIDKLSNHRKQDKARIRFRALSCKQTAQASVTR